MALMVVVGAEVGGVEQPLQVAQHRVAQQLAAHEERARALLAALRLLVGQAVEQHGLQAVARDAFLRIAVHVHHGAHGVAAPRLPDRVRTR
jgi:hypothetical protein